MKNLFNYLETHKNDAFLLILSRSSYKDCVKKYFPNELIQLIKRNGFVYHTEATFNKLKVFEVLNKELLNQFKVLLIESNTNLDKKLFFEELLYIFNDSSVFNSSVEKFLKQYDTQEYSFEDPWFLEIYESNGSFELHYSPLGDSKGNGYTPIILSEGDNIHKIADALQAYKICSGIDYCNMDYKKVVDKLSGVFNINTFIIKYLISRKCPVTEIKEKILNEIKKHGSMDNGHLFEIPECNGENLMTVGKTILLYGLSPECLNAIKELSKDNKIDFKKLSPIATLNFSRKIDFEFTDRLDPHYSGEYKLFPINIVGTELKSN